VIDRALVSAMLRHSVGPVLGELAAEAEEALEASAERLIELLARLTVRDTPKNRAPE
jgi:hypothetical protein